MDCGILHASCVTLDQQGILITGNTGTGKSTLALDLIDKGARLVSDDQTRVTSKGDRLWASRPITLPPFIEFRGVGLLHAPLADSTVLSLVVDLDKVEDQRLPTARHFTLSGCKVPLLHKVNHLSFASAIVLMLRNGRGAP